MTIATDLIASAAGQLDLLDPRPLHTRLHPALERLDRTLAHLDVDLGLLVGRQRRVDPALHHTGSEVRAALREVTHDGAGLADPATMATRSDVGLAVTTLLGHLGTSEFGYQIHDFLARPGLTVSGRGAHQLSLREAPTYAVPAWVDAADLHHDRAVNLPEPVRACVARQALAVADAHAVADGAAPDICIGELGDIHTSGARSSPDLEQPEDRPAGHRGRNVWPSPSLGSPRSMDAW